MRGVVECRIRFVSGLGYQVLTQHGWTTNPEEGDPGDAADMAALLVWRAYNGVTSARGGLAHRPDGVLVRVTVEEDGER